MGVTGAANVRVAEEADTAVLTTLAIILKVTYLLLICKLEANPGKVYYFLPPQTLDPLH